MSDACSAGCSVLSGDLLSAYVDEELKENEVSEVEDHIQACSHCRLELDGLSRVSRSLRGLERVAPPPILDEMVLGRLEIGTARSWSQRLDDLMGATQRTRSTIGPIFALVMMLVMLVFFFSEAQVRRNSRSVVISLPSVAAPSDPLTAEVAGVSFVQILPGQANTLTSGDDVPGAQHWQNFADRVGAKQVWLEKALLGQPVVSPERLKQGALSCISEAEKAAAHYSALTQAGSAESVVGPTAVVQQAEDGAAICHLLQ